MAKSYTAKEMRQAANAEELVGRPEVAAMLRQSADAMEREEKREKKYEFAVKRNGYTSPSFILVEDEARDAVEELNADGVAVSLVRREVGEWREVKDGE